MERFFHIQDIKKRKQTMISARHRALLETTDWKKKAWTVKSLKIICRKLEELPKSFDCIKRLKVK